MRAYHLIVSRDVTNDPIPRSTGTALAYVWTSWTETDTRKTVQGFFLGYMSKLEAHLSWWHTYSFFPSPVQFGRMLAPTPCHPAPSLFILILWTRKVLILNTIDPCDIAVLLWTRFICTPFCPSQRVPGKQLPLLSIVYKLCTKNILMPLELRSSVWPPWTVSQSLSISPPTLQR